MISISYDFYCLAFRHAPVVPLAHAGIALVVRLLCCRRYFFDIDSASDANTQYAEDADRKDRADRVRKVRTLTTQLSPGPGSLVQTEPNHSHHCLPFLPLVI